MNPVDAARSLAEAIRQSSEAEVYARAKDALKADQTALNMLSDFRKEQLKLLQLRAEGQELPRQDEERVQKLYDIITMNPTLKNYLDAELAISMMLQKVQVEIDSAMGKIIDRELSGLGGEDSGETEDGGESS